MQYSQAYNMAVYDTPNPQRIAHAIPQAHILGPEKIAVPCTLHNMQVMRYLGYQAVAPILFNYDWPIRPPHRPFDHQRATSAFLTLHPRCFLLNDIGTGKTLSVLWALDHLMQQGFVKKALILSPLSTLETVWLNEIFSNFLSRAKAVVVYGSREKRMRLLNTEAQYYIINHDGLSVGTERANKQIKLGGIASFVRDNPDFNAIVVDEGSTYKDSGTLRYKVLKQVIHSKPYVWWLTGTIAAKEPVDAWAQARAVRLDYAESQKNFKERTMYRVSTFKWLPRANAAQTTAEIIVPAIRFKREDCIDLPPFMTVDRSVELSPGQKKAYDDLKKQLRIMLKEGSVTAVNEAALRNKLIQISCGAVYGEQHQINKLDCSPRIAVMREVIETCNEKLLIFAPLTSVVNLLYDELKVDYSVEVINGAVSAAKRAEVFRNFQSSESPRIIVADPRTMAHGLTLTAASTIIWYGPTDQPEVYIQANGRINRPGQVKSMLAVRLASTPIEREIFRRLDGRHNLQGMMLDIIRGEEDGV
jgi:SNF2 family DNA or RNA helicase